MPVFKYGVRCDCGRLIPMTRRSAFLSPVGVLKSKMIFRARATVSVAFAIGFLFAIKARAANVLTDPGFETSGLAGWTTFGPNNYGENTAGLAHNGTGYCKVYGAFNGAQNYTGIFQVFPSASGTVYSADGC